MTKSAPKESQRIGVEQGGSMKTKNILSAIAAVFLVAIIVLVSQNLNTTLSGEVPITDNSTEKEETVKDVPKLTKTPS